MAGDAPVLSEELAWLKERPPEIPADLNEALPGALDLAHPLADLHQVTLDMSVPEALPRLAAHPVALGQTLLTLLSMGIQQAPRGRVTLSARSLPYEVEVSVVAERPVPDGDHAPQGDALREDMARELAALCGGSLAFADDRQAFVATLLVPILERLPVLVIEDNADTLQLMLRYSVGTRYRLVGAQDPGQALRLAEEFRPRIVVLDVMMPQVDGWKVLGQLRQHPLTSHVPVVVCTILAHEELALSLGASGFIRKPVSRQSFLAALDRQLAEMETGSC
jgi:CheY-like chemotaxis protein